MAWVKRWFAAMALGGMLLVSPTGCVVTPVTPGYMASPPLVVIRPYHPYPGYRPYHPHRHDHRYRSYRRYWPYEGWSPYDYRW